MTPGFPAPPGYRFARRTLGATAGEISSLVSSLSTLVQVLPGIAVSLERLANLEDELSALSKLDLQLERLADLQDELATLGRLEHALDRIAEFGTPLDNLTQPVADLAVATRSLPELSVAAQSLPALVAQVEKVQEIVTHMDGRFDTLVPMLDQIASFGVGLEHEIDDLGAALAPISRIASRLPGSRRRKGDEQA